MDISRTLLFYPLFSMPPLPPISSRVSERAANLPFGNQMGARDREVKDVCLRPEHGDVMGEREQHEPPVLKQTHSHHSRNTKEQSNVGQNPDDLRRQWERSDVIWQLWRLSQTNQPVFICLTHVLVHL